MENWFAGHLAGRLRTLGQILLLTVLAAFAGVLAGVLDAVFGLGLTRF